jgi:hypothetical protein
MTTTPSEDVVPNYGKGLVTYITADSGTEEIKADNIPQAIEDLVRFPLGEQLYIRPTWREVQFFASSCSRKPEIPNRERTMAADGWAVAESASQIPLAPVTRPLHGREATA